MVIKTVLRDKDANHDQQGYTLVEILVVMLISFIILGGVYKALTTESIEYDEEQIILDMQLNARAAFDIISADIRKAGFLGCSGNLVADTTSNSGTTDPIQANTSAGVINTNLPILNALKVDPDPNGINYLGAPLAYVNNVTNIPTPHPTYQTGTDVLSVRFLTGDEPLQTGMGTSTTSPLDLNTNDFSRGDILYITDCEFYSLFQKTNCSGTIDPAHATSDSCASEGAPFPSNTTDDLGQEYGLNSRVYKLVISTYFIQGGNLTVSQNNSGSTDIAENIEDLQFRYKWDANGNNDLSDDGWIDDPTAVAGLTANNIREIEIYVLARSEQVFSYTNNNTYDYPNSPYCSAAGAAAFTCSGTATPNDNRYRYLASTVVSLRNSDL